MNIISKDNYCKIKDFISSRDPFFINYFKTEGGSSRYHLNLVSRIMNVKKCGYAGTLDPFASGILPIAFNKGTLEIENIHTFEKEYLSLVKFGEKTETSDVTGKVIQSTEFIPKKKEIERSIRNFIGKTIQSPSIYSAIKVNGARLCDLVRTKKITEKDAFKITEQRAKEIHISSISVSQVDENRFNFLVKCSSGTYIRQLIEDIATNLESLAFVEKLERTSVGIFRKENSLSYEDIKIYK